MTYLLTDISEDIKEYIETISKLGNIDIEVLDAKKEKIVGIGSLDNNIGEKVESLIYDEVVKRKDKVIINNPTKSEICINCKHEYDCVVEMTIGSPIIYQDGIVGFVGIVLLKDETETVLKDRLDFYVDFINQITDFIIFSMYKINESQLFNSRMEILDSMLNNLNQNVIVLDSDNKVTKINKNALDNLGLTEKDQDRALNIIDRNESLMGGNLYNLILDDDAYQMVGRLLKTDSVFVAFQKVFIFDFVKEVDAMTYKVTYTRSDDSTNIDALVDKSKPMQELKNKIEKISSSHSSILLTGESGTGKELVARIIHDLSDRKDKPFISLNCSAVPKEMMEKELFGYVEGTFADDLSGDKIGKFEKANGGILLLDEIEEMPFHIQVKLLDVIKTNKVKKIGSNEYIDLDIRIIAASNVDLEERINLRKFRKDLYYRLSVIPLEVPPLRERLEDFDIFIERLINKYNISLDKDIQSIDKECLKTMKNYPWPGNVRELQNTMEYMINMAGDDKILTRKLLPKNILEHEQESYNKNKNKIRPLEEIELEHIHRALEICGDNTEGKRKAANKLGIGVATLYRKLQN